MARITVEDCLDHMPERNRFHLALLASRRARQLRAGATPVVRAEEDNYTVQALREIATGEVTSDLLDRVDRDLEGVQAFKEGTPSSAGEAAEALGAGIASGGEEAASAGAPQEAGAEEQASEEAGAPEEPEITEGEPEQDLNAGEESGADPDNGAL